LSSRRPGGCKAVAPGGCIHSTLCFRRSLILFTRHECPRPVTIATLAQRLQASLNSPYVFRRRGGRGRGASVLAWSLANLGYRDKALVDLLQWCAGTRGLEGLATLWVLGALSDPNFFTTMEIAQSRFFLNLRPRASLPDTSLRARLFGRGVASPVLSPRPSPSVPSPM